MPTQDRIEINPKVMLGKPIIRGTRITVELILRKLGEGATHRDLLEAYPHLTENDLQAATCRSAGFRRERRRQAWREFVERFVVLQPGRIRFGGNPRR